MAKLLFLFILTPALELALVIEVGQHIGTLNTLLLIAVTGVVGASLARRQGLEVLRRMQAEFDQGRIPSGSIVDGVIILLSGALLITPGLLTDTVGFLCLVPTTRAMIRSLLWGWIQRHLRVDRVNFPTQI